MMLVNTPAEIYITGVGQWRIFFVLVFCKF